MTQGPNPTGGPGPEGENEFFITFEPDMVSVGVHVEPDVRWHNYHFGPKCFEPEENDGDWERCTFNLHGEEATLRIRTNDDRKAQEVQVLIGERLIAEYRPAGPYMPTESKLFKYSAVPSDK
jgi:hypothetical protein